MSNCRSVYYIKGREPIFTSMKHYICTGECAGASEKPGVCQSQMCSKHGQPLSECECPDGKHGKKDEKKK